MKKFTNSLLTATTVAALATSVSAEGVGGCRKNRSRCTKPAS